MITRIKNRNGGYDVEFGIHSTFSLSDGFGDCGGSVIFGKDNSPSMHVDRWKESIMVLQKSPTDGIVGSDSKVTANT